MSPDSTIVDSLVALNGDPASIRELWERALQALVERSTVLIHINSSTRDGHSDAGIPLSDPDDIRVFCASCKEAIRLLAREDDDDDALDPSSMGRGTDRSRRIIRV